MGALYAMRQGKFRPYHDRVYERFWRRELDIGDREKITAVLAEVGAAPEGFAAYLEKEGPEELAVIQKRADEDQVFGVPMFFVAGEPFWGNDRVPWVRKKLDTLGLRKD
jgi:2-hydroxychromene-2-carboxylate isomerase